MLSPAVYIPYQYLVFSSLKQFSAEIALLQVQASHQAHNVLKVPVRYIMAKYDLERSLLVFIQLGFL
jgi:hypothetical protein